MEKYIFEVLCIDSKGASVITNANNLLNRLLGNGILWKQASLKNIVIEDELMNIKLTCKSFENNPDTAKISIAIKVEGEENLENFRLELIKHLRSEKFDYLYIRIVATLVNS